MKLIALFLLLTLFSVPGFTEGIPDHDRRNTSIRHTDMHYEFGDYGSLAEWKQRAQHLRRQVQFSAGLMPWPEKTPLHAEVFDKTEHEDYTIEKVILETYPGFFLGGNLFRPVGKPGPYPAVVSPHGHWRFGRLENQQLNSTIGRGITLARQGYIVLNYDMVGYNDTAAHIAHHQDWDGVPSCGASAFSGYSFGTVFASPTFCSPCPMSIPSASPRRARRAAARKCFCRPRSMTAFITPHRST